MHVQLASLGPCKASHQRCRSVQSCMGRFNLINHAAHAELHIPSNNVHRMLVVRNATCCFRSTERLVTDVYSKNKAGISPIGVRCAS